MFTPPDSALSRLFTLTAELNDIDQELLREKDRYKTLSAITIAANKAESHTDLFKSTIPILCKDLGFEGAGAYLIHRESDTAVLKHAFNISPETEHTHKHIKITEQPFKDILGANTVFVFSDELSQSFNCTLMVFVPLISTCGVVGGIVLYSKQKTTMSPSAEVLLPLISIYLGDSLRRIWSEKLLKSENERYKALLHETDVLVCENESKSQELTAINEEMNHRVFLLNTENSMLKSIIDTVPFPVFWKTAGGVYLGANRIFYEMLEIPAEDFVGKTLNDIFPPIYWDEYEKTDKEALDCHFVDYIGIYYLKRDSAQCTGRFIKQLFYDSEHKPLGLICVIIPCENPCSDVKKENE